MRFVLVILLAALPLPAAIRGQSPLQKKFQSWTREDAVWILNRSPWARRETFTRVVGGIGSGVRGEKEILSTYFVRFLSARPIREAFVRIQQIQRGYHQMTAAQKRRFDQMTQPGLDLDVRRWIVVAVAFRSNDSDQEIQFQRHLRAQTLETLRNTTSLSTRRFPELQPVAYFPPQEDSVGAKFVFPRLVDGSPVTSPQDREITFEMEAPVATDQLRSTFQVQEMRIGEEWLL
ncbi:MAG: hypothetical protein V3T83_01890 [Acidobacteriota bacterium]